MDPLRLITHSRWFADDGDPLAESCAALQRMVDAAAKWARKWRVEFRIGTDKSAVMVFSNGSRSLKQHVYLNVKDGSRVPLPYVSSYKYLGPVFQASGQSSELIRAILRIGHSRTREVVLLARRHGLPVSVIEAIWKSKADCSLRFFLAFVDLTDRCVGLLCQGQIWWGRVLLGCDSTAPAAAVIGDLGWPHIAFQILDQQLCLLQRCLKDTHQPVYVTLHCVLKAAASAKGTWTNRLCAVISSACADFSVIDDAWDSPMAVRHARVVYKRAEANLWVASCAASDGLNNYHHSRWNLHPLRKLDVLLYRSRVLRIGPSAPYLFGRLHAGGRLGSIMDLPVCPFCKAKRPPSLEHLLRYCPASQVPRLQWIMRLPSNALPVALSGTDADFLRLVFDTGHSLNRSISDVDSQIEFVAAAAKVWLSLK